MSTAALYAGIRLDQFARWETSTETLTKYDPDTGTPRQVTKKSKKLYVYGLDRLFQEPDEVLDYFDDLGFDRHKKVNFDCLDYEDSDYENNLKLWALTFEVAEATPYGEECVASFNDSALAEAKRAVTEAFNAAFNNRNLAPPEVQLILCLNCG